MKMYLYTKKILKLAASIGIFATMAACSTYRPILDENPQYAKVGSYRAEADIDECMRKADNYLESHKSERMTKQLGRGAMGGALVGGALGALTGKSSNLLAGAAIGAGFGAASAGIDEGTKDKLKPDELKQRYVSNCLVRKNYQVIGWK